MIIVGLGACSCTSDFGETDTVSVVELSVVLVKEVEPDCGEQDIHSKPKINVAPIITYFFKPFYLFFLTFI